MSEPPSNSPRPPAPSPASRGGGAEGESLAPPELGVGGLPSYPRSQAGEGGASPVAPGEGLPRICALVPAFNEEDRIASTLRSLASRREIHAIYVVDDGSTDETQARVRETGAAALVTQGGGNVGKGGALTAAYAVLRKTAPPFDIFLLLDADLGASASECVKLLPPLLNGTADMTIGTLPPDPEFAQSGERGGFGLATGLARWAINRRTGQTFAQPLSGQRAVRREVLDALGGTFASGFGVEVALTMGALAQGFRVVEVPTEFRHHVTGGDWKGVWHRARQLWDVARAVWR